MAFDFTEEHKEEVINTYFAEGVHKVDIKKVEALTNPAGKDYIEFTVEGEAGESEKVKTWFVGGAAKWSFNTCRGIMVHNAPAGKKDSIRDSINKLKNTDELVKALKNLEGKGKAWITKYQNFDTPYTKEDGSTGYYYNTNIYSYEPPARKNSKDGAQLAADVVNGDGTSTDPLKDADGDEIFKF